MTLNCSHAFIHFKTCRRILKLEIPPPNTIIKLSFKRSEEMNGFIVEDWCQSCPRLTSKSTWDTLIVHFTLIKVYVWWEWSGLWVYPPIPPYSHLSHASPFPSLSFVPKQLCFYVHTIPHRAFDVPIKYEAHEWEKTWGFVLLRWHNLLAITISSCPHFT